MAAAQPNTLFGVTLAALSTPRQPPMVRTISRFFPLGSTSFLTHPVGFFPWVDLGVPFLPGAPSVQPVPGAAIRPRASSAPWMPPPGTRARPSTLTRTRPTPMSLTVRRTLSDMFRAAPSVAPAPRPNQGLSAHAPVFTPAGVQRMSSLSTEAPVFRPALSPEAAVFVPAVALSASVLAAGPGQDAYSMGGTNTSPANAAFLHQNAHAQAMLEQSRGLCLPKTIRLGESWSQPTIDQSAIEALKEHQRQEAAQNRRVPPCKPSPQADDSTREQKREG